MSDNTIGWELNQISKLLPVTYFEEKRLHRAIFTINSNVIYWYTRSPYTVHCLMGILLYIHCTSYSVQCTSYSVHRSLFAGIIVVYIMYVVRRTPFTIRWVYCCIYNVRRTAYVVHYSLGIL